MKSAALACGATTTASALIGRAKLQARAAVEQFTADELLALYDSPGPLPDGPMLAEVAVAYLTAMHRGVPPVPVAGSRLKALGANDADFKAFCDWLTDLAEREMQAAAALEAYARAKFGGGNA